jgi:hypothetical protein
VLLYHHRRQSASSELHHPSTTSSFEPTTAQPPVNYVIHQLHHPAAFYCPTLSSPTSISKSIHYIIIWTDYCSATSELHHLLTTPSFEPTSAQPPVNYIIHQLHHPPATSSINYITHQLHHPAAFYCPTLSPPTSVSILWTTSSINYTILWTDYCSATSVLSPSTYL